MREFPIEESVEAALDKAHSRQPDSLGYIRYTFRIELQAHTTKVDLMLGQLLNHGWQMTANPLICRKIGDVPKHVVFSMILLPDVWTELRLEGRFDGVLHGRR